MITDHINGCDSFPEALLWWTWKHCCDVHDVAYSVGGSEWDRLVADFNLAGCVAGVSPILAIIAAIMLAGTTLAGWLWFRFKRLNGKNIADILTTVAEATQPRKEAPMTKEVLTIEQLEKMTPAKDGAKERTNMASVCLAFNEYGQQFGVDKHHVIAHILAQVMEESGMYRYDREVWGPTAAQKRYDTRKDLGNTPEVDGDGERNAGKGPIQVTGGHNLRAYTKWAKKNFGALAPDFFKNPELINTDPWEGLSIIWYWDDGNPTGKSLNVYADRNDPEMITRRINGGLTHYGERLANYTRAALVLLGYDIDGDQFSVSLRVFQTIAKRDGSYDGTIDGIDGPKSRAALHAALAAKDDVHVTLSPVVEKAPEAEKVVIEKPVAIPVAPKAAAQQGRNYFALIMSGIAGSVPVIGGFLVKFDPWVQLGFFAVAALLLVFVWFNLRRIVMQVKTAIDLVAGNEDVAVVSGAGKTTAIETMSKDDAQATGAVK